MTSHVHDYGPLAIEPRGGMPMLIKQCACDERCAISLRKYASKNSIRANGPAPLVCAGERSVQAAAARRSPAESTSRAARVVSQLGGTTRRESRGVLRIVKGGNA